MVPLTVKEFGLSIDISRLLYDDMKAAQECATAHTFCAAMHSPQDWSHPQCYFCSWAYRWYCFWDTIDEVVGAIQNMDEEYDCDCTCCNH